MAQCTMHLFILGLLLLIVTVITAFRLRDLSPQVTRDSESRLGQTIKFSNTNPPYEYCVTCDSFSAVDRDSKGVNNVVSKKIKRKHVTNKITYSEIKLAVKEKQNLINLRHGKISEVIGIDTGRKHFHSETENGDGHSDMKIDDSTSKPEKSDFNRIGNDHKVNKKQSQNINREEHHLADTDSSAEVDFHDKKIVTSSIKHEYMKNNISENSKDTVTKPPPHQQNIKLSKQPDIHQKNHESKDNVPYEKVASIMKPIEKISTDSKNKNSNAVHNIKDEYSSDEEDIKVEKKSLRKSETKKNTPKEKNIVDLRTMNRTIIKTENKKNTDQKKSTNEAAANTEKDPKMIATKKKETKEAIKHDLPKSHCKEEQKKVHTEHKKTLSKNDAKKDDKTYQQTPAKKQESGRKKRVDDAIYRKNLLQYEFEDFYSFLPTFAPNYSRIHNPECRRHGQILLRQLRGTKLWALQMLDSSAKIPSGLLRGNGNQLGDFDQCLASQARVRLDSGAVVRVRGKYCLAHVDVEAVHADLHLPVHLALGRNMIRSSNTDPGHFVPRFTSLLWGICMPAACGASEASFALRDALRHYNGTAGLRTRVHVDDHDCRELSERAWWSRWIDDVPTPLCVFFFISFGLMVTYATLIDFIQRSNIEMTSENKDMPGEHDSESATPDFADENAKDATDADAVPIDTQPKGSKEGPKKSSFSLYETSRKIFKQGTDEGEIACIHGVRAVCSVALLMAHKLIPMAMTPFTNRIYLTELSNSPLSILLRASLIYTDSFLLLSGVLTAYHMSQDLNATGSIPWLRRYIARYIRLTPALFAVVVWYAWVADKIGDGPQWGSLVVTNADLCRKNFWKNILYIHNFFSFEEMCAPHTHQLALDMQLTLLAPAVVWALHARPRAGLVSLAALHTLSVYLRYSATIDNNLSLVIYHGITSGQLYRTANLSYSIALHRATPYVAGVSLGFFLRRLGNDKTRISRVILYPGWLLCASFGGWTLHAASHMAARDYRYDVAEAALYAALASLAWAVCLSWIIFACSTGNGGLLNTVLCAQPLLILSRISYAMYLCQFLVFFYNVGSIRTSMELDVFSFIDIIEITKILGLSVLITAVFIIPMQSLQKHIMSYDFGCKERIQNEMEENAKDETSEEAYEEERVEYIVDQVEVEPEEHLDNLEPDLEYEEYNVLEEIMEEEEEEDEELLNSEFDEVNLERNSLWRNRRNDGENNTSTLYHLPPTADLDILEDEEEEDLDTATSN